MAQVRNPGDECNALGPLPSARPVMPDRHELYEIAVQQPERMVGFIERAYSEICGGDARVLREDFCGTANLATTWVRSASDCRATAVDSDASVLRYAQRRHRVSLGAAASRLRLINNDVLRCRAVADVIVSLNFSHFIYQTREDLLRYFRHVRRCLAPRGLFICDAYGGPGAQRPSTDRRRFGDFTYLWEQASYDPITAQVVNHIHFRLRGGHRINRAFTYHWRLWTLAELRETLTDAGFPEPRIWYETDRGLTERFNPANAEAWVAYLVAAPLAPKWIGAVP